MGVFLLVHGAWHGAWCWHRLTPLLEAAGHRVVSPDLPGHGDDDTHTKAITLERYAERVLAAIEAHPEPVTAVGHSMGGIVITRAAEHAPERFARLVYVCAFLPRARESLMEIAARGPSALEGNLHPVAGETRLALDLQRVEEIFYHDCPASDVALARARLCPAPVGPMIMPVEHSRVSFGTVPRLYVECLQDRAVPIETQRAMVAAQPTPVVSLDTGHSPFFAAPEALARTLTDR